VTTVAPLAENDGLNWPHCDEYLECRRALADELGLSPSAETAELRRRVLAGELV